MHILPTDTPLGSLELQQVIEYYDFPRTFTCRNTTGQRYLVVSTFDDEDECHWLYLPLSELRHSAVMSGQIPLHLAFRTPEGGYVFEVKTVVNGPAIVNYLLPEQILDEDLPSPGYVAKGGVPETDEHALEASPAEVASATRRETFNYRIFPNESSRHEIAARKLGGVLTVTQELLDALGQAVTGSPTVRGPIPAELLHKTQVNVSHSFPGSFGVQFRSTQHSDLLDQSVISDALAEFANMILAGDSEDLLSNKLHSLKGRVTSKYRRLLKELNDVNSGLVLDWGAVLDGRGGQFSLTPDQVKNAYAIVDHIDLAMAEEVTVQGKLIGFNSRTKRYEILSSDGETAYSGKVSEDAQIEVGRPAIGQNYVARLRMLVETQSTSGDELIRWVLVGLSE